jgi:hypothetical protein
MIGIRMSKQKLNPEELDAWQSQRNLDRMKAPTRHAVAAWALAAAVALAAFLGPPAARQAAAGLVELRHGVLMLDSGFERVGMHFQSARRGASAVSPANVAEWIKPSALDGQL